METTVTAPGQPAPARKRATLAPVKKTVMLKRIIRRGSAVTEHRECWEAVTTGDYAGWTFCRLEGVPGTPWAVWHEETDITVDMCSNLTECRAWVANGGAQEALDLILAHRAGKHDGQRAVYCGECARS